MTRTCIRFYGYSVPLHPMYYGMCKESDLKWLKVHISPEIFYGSGDVQEEGQLIVCHYRLTLPHNTSNLPKLTDVELVVCGEIL